MKRILSIVLFSLCMLSTHAKELKVLAIGNSFSVDAVEQNLYELAKANGDRIVIGNMHIGGCSLERHYLNLKIGRAHV